MHGADGKQRFCVDVDRKKIDNLKRGIIPIYEPGLEPLVAENYKAGTLRFTTDIKEAIDSSEVCCIAVGTPMVKTAALICSMFYRQLRI